MIHAQPIAQHSATGSRRMWLRSAWLMAALVAVSTATSAQPVTGNGQPASEARTTAAFTAIAVQDSIGLELRQGSPASVVVHADGNLLSLLQSEVDNQQTLRLRWQHGVSVHTRNRVWVEVTAPVVQALSSAGSADIAVDTLQGTRLSVSLRGSGGLSAKALQLDELSLALNGSGQATLAGKATRCDASLAGSGRIDAARLQADSVRVSISGSGGADVQAVRALTVNIAGSGDVTYSGEPSLQTEVAGSGRVRKR